MNLFFKITIYTLVPMFFFNCHVIASGMVPCEKYEHYRHLCYGTQFYSNGAKYIGEWQNRKKSGQGVYTFSNGNIYIGEFLDDSIHGQGTYIFSKNAKSKFRGFFLFRSIFTIKKWFC